MNKTLIASYSRKDFRVDTFCSGGPGGQHQNKTQSGIRIVHLPTGLSAESREHRSQLQNKKAAFRRLSRQIQRWHQEQSRTVRERNLDVVRTYHVVENRVKDHLTGFQQSWDEVTIDLSDMIDDRLKACQQ